MMSVSDETRNNRRASDLAIRVYASETPTNFTLREDDGESFAYRDGRVATTVLAQQLVGETARIDLGAATDQVYLSLYGTGFRGFSSASAVSATVGGVNVPVAGS